MVNQTFSDKSGTPLGKNFPHSHPLSKNSWWVPRKVFAGTMAPRGTTLRTPGCIYLDDTLPLNLLGAGYKMKCNKNIIHHRSCQQLKEKIKWPEVRAACAIVPFFFIITIL